MRVAITFRHMNVSDSLKDQITERMTKILERYFDEAANCHVIFTKEKFLNKVEININANGIIICGKETSEDMYNSIMRAVEKIEKQISRYKEKMLSSKPREGAKLKMQFKLLEAQGSDHEQASKDLPHNIVETNEFHAREMMLDEAVMQMDLLGNDVLVFLNPKTNHINVLYRKPNNKYGLIETI